MPKVRITDHSPKLLKLADDVAAETLLAAAFATEAKAKEIVASRPIVDTGSLLNSIHVRSEEFSGRNAAIQRAGKRPARSRRTGRMVNDPPGYAEAEGKPSKTTIIIAAAVEYAVFIEFGSMQKRGNTQRLGKRKGREGVRIREGESDIYGAGLYTNIPARPFLRPALEATSKKLTVYLKDSLKKKGF